MSKSVSTRRALAAGCEATRFNALRHGLLSAFVVLPWEDEAEYRRLLEALVAEHKPRGPVESHLVQEVAGVIWRKRRLRLAEGAAWRRGLRSVPSRETTDAALAHLNLFEKQADGVGKQLADLVQDRASIASALELLHAGKARSYDKALSNLSKETRARWDEATRSKPAIELFDYNRPSFSDDADGLVKFLRGQALGFDDRRKGLEDRLEGLNRYEVHLDRKLERMLTVLIRLQDLRRDGLASSK
jgi:hypothetical protein